MGTEFEGRETSKDSQTLILEPNTPNPKPQTLNPKLETPNPKPQTPNPESKTLIIQNPYQGVPSEIPVCLPRDEFLRINAPEGMRLVDSPLCVVRNNNPSVGFFLTWVHPSLEIRCKHL